MLMKVTEVNPIDVHQPGRAAVSSEALLPVPYVLRNLLSAALVCHFEGASLEYVMINNPPLLSSCLTKGSVTLTKNYQAMYLFPCDFSLY